MDAIGIIDKLARPVSKDEGDYTEDGLLVCGKCHTPKQKRLELQREDGGMSHRLVPVLCQCATMVRDQEQAEHGRKQFMFHMDQCLERFGVSDRAYRGYTFAQDDRQNSKLSDVCSRYIDHWEDMKTHNIGILFYGSVGTGKSFYSCCIVNALMERCVPAAVTNFPRLLNLLQGTQDRQELIDHLQTYQLLVIDDLGVERDSSYAAEQVFNVIDARARSGLPLIVTTNLTMDELRAPASMQYARIYDRVLELCPVPIKMTGESRRLGNAAVRKDRARELLRL